eukprot:CAMPEP_0179904710 /NCGR_PEP_ID=MMETSP0982-20121206/42099_1 /TAXON_ID=483367 /ORGANISM="non described non described, Strain CCMP 2436" /LENGTH=30 /DNA_ID= /DNA_START= /DNA_END= /DNA_ORIENTATION=
MSAANDGKGAKSDEVCSEVPQHMHGPFAPA